MSSHDVRFELDLDYQGPDWMAAASLSWTEETSWALGLGLRERMEQGPALSAKALRSPVPCGPPGAAWGMYEVIRRGPKGNKAATRLAYKANVPKISALMAPAPQDELLEASVRLYVLDGEGNLGDQPLGVYASRNEDAADSGVRFVFEVSEEALEDRSFQRACREHLLALARQGDPLYGETCYAHGYMGDTVVEAVFGPPWLLFHETIRTARERLRGYGWITVVPKELAARLGGAEALRAGQRTTRDGRVLRWDLAEVVELPSGALWVQATDDYFDYDRDAAERLVYALAPVLPAGRPAEAEPDVAMGIPPYKYPDLDPAELR